jgi:hypothetical protein
MPPRGGNAQQPTTRIADFFAHASQSRREMATASTRNQRLTGLERISSGTSLSDPRGVIEQQSILERIVAQRDPSALNADQDRALRIAFGGNTDAAGVESTTIEFSLHCPYSKCRIAIPVRGAECAHIQCCDAASWATHLSKGKMMRDPVADCPICVKRTALSSLRVDEWFASILEKMKDTNLVELHVDGACLSGDRSRQHRKREREETVIEPTQEEASTTTVDVKIEGRPTKGAVELGLDSAESPESDDASARAPCLDRAFPIAVVPSNNYQASTQAVAYTIDVLPLADTLSSQRPLIRRFLPTGWRNWLAFCLDCRVECCSEQGVDPTMMRCPSCNVTESMQRHWSLVRKFDGRGASTQWSSGHLTGR